MQINKFKFYARPIHELAEGDTSPNVTQKLRSDSMMFPSYLQRYCIISWQIAFSLVNVCLHAVSCRQQSQHLYNYISNNYISNNNNRNFTARGKIYLNTTGRDQKHVSVVYSFAGPETSRSLCCPSANHVGVGSCCGGEYCSCSGRVHSGSQCPADDH